jgi:hypothetical protein
MSQMQDRCSAMQCNAVRYVVADATVMMMMMAALPCPALPCRHPTGESTAKESGVVGN